MKRNIFIIIAIVIIILIISIYFVFINSNKKDSHETNENNDVKKNNDSNEFINKIDVNINNQNYTLILEDNTTTKELFKSLPLNFEMEELNGNEKYIYLDKTYPTDSYNPKNINKGDVMLYGDNCLVIFYKSFDTSYSYTKVGHTDNLEDLGNENINVQFNIEKK